MCLTWCRHRRPRRLTCQVPVAGHQRRDRSRAFPGPVLRGVVRNRPSGAPGRQKLEDVCGPPGRMNPLNEGDDHDDSAECPCHWRASSSGKQGSKWGKTGSGEPRIFPARWPFTRDYQISTVCFASRGSWVRFPSSPPGLTRRDSLIATPVRVTDIGDLASLISQAAFHGTMASAWPPPAANTLVVPATGLTVPAARRSA
jgi:hypothetical protein